MKTKFGKVGEDLVRLRVRTDWGLGIGEFLCCGITF